MSDPELLFAMFEQFFSTAEQARDVCANLHIEFATRLGRKHRVIADHVANIEDGQLQPFGEFGNDLVGKKADLVLGI